MDNSFSPGMNNRREKSGGRRVFGLTFGSENKFLGRFVYFFYVTGRFATVEKAASLVITQVFQPELASVTFVFDGTHKF